MDSPTFSSTARQWNVTAKACWEQAIQASHPQRSRLKAICALAGKNLPNMRMWLIYQQPWIGDRKVQSILLRIMANVVIFHEFPCIFYIYKKLCHLHTCLQGSRLWEDLEWNELTLSRSKFLWINLYK